MSQNANRASELKLLDTSALKGIDDGKPVTPNGIKLANGIFVDKAGQSVAAVKPNIWY